MEDNMKLGEESERDLWRLVRNWRLIGQRKEGQESEHRGLA